jgi:hypothetical protein
MISNAAPALAMGGCFDAKRLEAIRFEVNVDPQAPVR